MLKHANPWISKFNRLENAMQISDSVIKRQKKRAILASLTTQDLMHDSNDMISIH